MSRRVARELALRALFMVEQGHLKIDDALAEARHSLPRSRSTDPVFVEALAHGTFGNLSVIDQAVGPHLHNWAVEQMSAVDRTILRLAAFELLFTGEPVSAVIDEAVTLAKIYGTPESGRFVNGVLGSLVRSGRSTGGLADSPAAQPQEPDEADRP